MNAQARSGFFVVLEMPNPWFVGVAQYSGACATPSVLGLIQEPWPFTKK